MARIHDKDEKFIPTFEEWGRFYSEWSEKLVKSLWMSGSELECREAVHEAFLKAMGLSDHLRLNDELSAKEEGCWYGFLRGQARGILSNYHRSSDRYVPMKDFAANECDGAEPVYVADFGCGDGEWLRKGVRSALVTVCNRAGVSERNRMAFEMFVLDGMDSEEVVSSVPGIGNANNLYQIKNRIMRILSHGATGPDSVFAELRAA